MGMNVLPEKSSMDDEFEPIAEINITPFVDVMLVLLIVFMITAPMLTSGVTVDLPDTQAAAIAQSDDVPVEITLTRTGEVYVADTEVVGDKLLTILEQATNANKDSRIYIRADEVLDYGAVMRLLGRINKAGYNKVALLSNGQ